jgi:hypothetical protein
MEKSTYINLFMSVSSEDIMPEGSIAKIVIDEHKALSDEIERLRNKVRWLDMCENTVVKQDVKIERLRKVIIKITHHIDDNQSGLFIKTFALAALKEGE